ncbi:DENN domain-containing protein 5B [Phytophthora cinnamomi]|uniref:DENN domain-containing protein 5B n=1 Tax=Phytophthora cinnamomi TaxID=4785 RepID=UPI00355A6304|nr:DENN domain-containing protein 5B [Phytophthora cinnamomi]
MSTGASVAHAIASLAHTGSTNPQEPSTFGHQYNVLNMQPAFQQPTATNLDAARHSQSINSATNNAAAVLTSVSRVGLPAAAAATPKKRSTKSKCSPGLRSGKWTPEEEAFTNMIIHYFKRGLLDVEDGTSLRWYLAKRLNCEAMRVTKKLKGNSSIGKQIFRAMENTPANRQAILA